MAAQENSGSRRQAIPGARCRTVTIRLIAKQTNPARGEPDAGDPGVGAVGGGIEDGVRERRQRSVPASGACRGSWLDRHAAGEVEPVGELVEAWQRHAAGADLQRDDVADQPSASGIAKSTTNVTPRSRAGG